MLWKPKLIYNLRGKSLKASLLLGITLGCGFNFQAIGLIYTTASKSAFITAISALMVPPLAIILEKTKPRWTSVTGLLISIVGVYLMVRPEGKGINIGDVWTLGCAISFAFYIVYLQIYSKKVPVMDIILGQFLVVGIGSWIASLIMLEPVTMPDTNTLLTTVYLVLGCTFLTAVLQTRFQKETTSTRAGLILTAEPVFATLFAWLVLHEILNGRQLIGGGLIIVGLLTGIAPPPKNKNSNGKYGVETSDQCITSDTTK
jgi:drug/metabolite transporter (DMT)-like permease